MLHSAQVFSQRQINSEIYHLKHYILDDLINWGTDGYDVYQNVLTLSGFPPLGSKLKIIVVSKSLRPVSALKRLRLQAYKEENRQFLLKAIINSVQVSFILLINM